MFGAILPATVARIAKKVSLALLAACLPVVAQSAQNTTHYRWSADNRLTEVQSGNTRVSYGYDALGRRISRTWQQGNHTRETQWVLDTARPYSEIVLERTRQNGGAWKERAYVHTPDGVGLQISESEEGQTRHIYTDAQGSTRLITDEAGNVLQTLDYDADGKLTQESISAAGITRTCRYSHDSTGNRTEKDCDGQKTRYVYNQLDQLTEEQTTPDKTTYRWDGRGNLIEKQTPAQTIRYTWSSDNRLMQASDGSTIVSYGYDALGRRISRTKETGAQKEETQWVLDTARPYSEIVLERSRQNGGAWQETRYTHTPDGVGQLISEQRQGKTLHVYEDGQGSARLITDESGQIIETLDFDAFGNEEAGAAKESRHRYTGESYDSATGLYHLRARDYDPKTGRFISMDEHPGSQSIPLTLNKYLYGNADPVNHIDPSGNIFTIAIAMPNVVNLRSQQIIVSDSQVYRANEVLRRLAVGSVKQLKALRKA